jgi:hypothetical protein
MRLRRLLILVAVIGATVVAWRARVASERRDRPGPLDSASLSPGPAPWVEAVDGACPLTHPVKVKVSSGIYHLPGSRFYTRTRPERCYVDAAAAEADGYRAAKAATGSAARSSV